MNKSWVVSMIVAVVCTASAGVWTWENNRLGQTRSKLAADQLSVFSNVQQLAHLKGESSHSSSPSYNLMNLPQGPDEAGLLMFLESEQQQLGIGLQSLQFNLGSESKGKITDDWISPTEPLFPLPNSIKMLDVTFIFSGRDAQITAFLIDLSERSSRYLQVKHVHIQSGEGTLEVATVELEAAYRIG